MDEVSSQQRAAAASEVAQLRARAADAERAAAAANKVNRATTYKHWASADKRVPTATECGYFSESDS